MNDDLVRYLSILVLPAVIGAAYGRWRWGVGAGVVLTLLVEVILIEFYIKSDTVWYYSQWRTWASVPLVVAVCAAIGVLTRKLVRWILRVCHRFIRRCWEAGRRRSACPLAAIH